MSKEAMQLALEALESDPISHAGLVSRKQAITALRQALEEKQEPVYWSVAIDELRQALEAKREHEWVGLHGSEVPDTYKYDVMFMEGWLWAEEKLKEKNKW